MKIYFYDPVTGFFRFEGFADPSPLEPGAWLIPAYATPIEPPQVQDGYIAAFFDGKWQAVALPVIEPQLQYSDNDSTPLTAQQKLEAIGLSVEELKELLGIS